MNRIKQEKRNRDFAAGRRVEYFAKAALGLSGLQATVFGIFLFGVFGGGLGDESAEPALDQESSEVTNVAPGLPEWVSV